MKKARPYVLLGSIALTAALALSGCSSSDNGNSEKPITITQFTADSSDKAYVEDLVKDFEASHPNIKVKIVKAPYDQYESKLQSLIAAGTTPDVTSHFGTNGFADYMDKEMIMDMTDLLKEMNFNPADYGLSDELMNIYKVEGKTYGLPVYSYTSLMLYNKDMFDKANLPYPPADYEDQSWTFDKMVEVAKKLTVTSNNPEEAQWGLDFNWGPRDMYPTYFGGGVYPPETFTTGGGRPAKVDFSSPASINAYQRLSDLMYKDKVSIDPINAKVLSGQGGNAFSTGKVAMSVGGAWILAGSNDYSFKVGVAAIPSAGNDKVRDVLYVDPLFILKDSKHPKEALEWIEYQLTKDVQEKAVALSGGTPPSNSEAAGKFYANFSNIDPADLQKVYEGGIKYGIESSNHLIVGYGELDNIIKNEMQPLENGKKAAAELLPDLEKHVNDILAKRKK
ncbi:ABC transporter substrate-binding protein [Paenibacillus sp. FJAT-27812]|uniref:ABC transporter substrate-binding protein n=1 Tax=Paenibacillus sp. FJAT-27812 TaxID=1684143 RepID=UPI0006A7A732|nr:sugar ABC transporter substrate-binding protein [Paenibacillus sp. FJAT-27812]